jgi:hypothetical protein
MDGLVFSISGVGLEMGFMGFCMLYCVGSGTGNNV